MNSGTLCSTALRRSHVAVRNSGESLALSVCRHIQRTEDETNERRVLTAFSLFGTTFLSAAEGFNRASLKEENDALQNRLEEIEARIEPLEEGSGTITVD